MNACFPGESNFAAIPPFEVQVVFILEFPVEKALKIPKHLSAYLIQLSGQWEPIIKHSNVSKS